jgi:hypothetical protein
LVESVARMGRKGPIYPSKAARLAAQSASAVPPDLRGQLESTRLDLLALFRAVDRMRLAQDMPPKLRALGELDADFAEASDLPGGGRKRCSCRAREGQLGEDALDNGHSSSVRPSRAENRRLMNSISSFRPSPSPAVNPQDIAPAEWTFFVYMNADNDLEPYGKADLNEMERAGSLPGKLNVIALVDGFADAASGSWTSKARLLWIQKDPTNSDEVTSQEIWVDPASELGRILARDNGEVDMGDPATLNAALKYVQQNIPSEQFFADLWSHGDGWKSASRDDHGTHLTPFGNELTKGFDGVNVDVLGFDACVMATLEVAIVAQQIGAKYLVGSEMIAPKTGWDYVDLFARFAQLFDQGNATPRAISEEIVRSFAAGDAENYQLSATDLSKLDELELALEKFVDAAMRKDSFALAELREAFNNAVRADGDPHQVDLGNFAKNLANHDVDEVSEAAAAVAEVLSSATFSMERTNQRRRTGTTGLTAYGPAVTGWNSLDPRYFYEGNPWLSSSWARFTKLTEDYQVRAQREGWW